MSLFLKLLSDSGDASSKRFVLVVAGLSLSAAVVLLAISAMCGKSVVGELSAVSTALAGLASVSYVGGRFVDKGDPNV
jgi:hypothetical protein